MDTTVVLNSFPKTCIFITAFFISVKINFHTLFIVAIVTKFRNLSLLYDFFAMETTVVLNNFPTIQYFCFHLLISVKNDLYTILFVAMVTKFNNSR